jgi:dihydrofolate reductase
MAAFLERTDTILFGRKSYDLQASFEQEYFPGHRKIVISHEERLLREGYELMQSPGKSDVHSLVSGNPKDTWLFGGESLTRQCLEWGILDVLMLAVHPILLGSGKRLFNPMQGRRTMQLEDAVPYSSGLVQLTYRLD